MNELVVKMPDTKNLIVIFSEIFLAAIRDTDLFPFANTVNRGHDCDKSNQLPNKMNGFQ